MSLNKYIIFLLLKKYKFKTLIENKKNIFFLTPNYIVSINYKLNSFIYFFNKLYSYKFNNNNKNKNNLVINYYTLEKRKLLTPYLNKLSYLQVNDLYNFFFFFTKKSNKNIINFALLEYTYLLQLFFYKIFNFFFFLNFINVTNIIDENFLLHYSNLLLDITPKQFKFYYFTELSEILLSGVITKNLFFLYRWIKFNIEKRSLKLFSAFKSFLDTLFLEIFWSFRDIISLKGIFIKFKGKFLKGGGRKKKTILTIGKYSSSSKNLRLVYKKFYIRTISGVIGCTLKLSY